MTASQELFWWVLMLMGLASSALYSGAETGFYCLNKVRLHLLEHKQISSAKTLARLAQQPTMLLTTLLIGTNLGNYIGTSAVVVLLETQNLNDWQLIIANALIVTPLLFIFVETLPKDLFAAHSDTLTYKVAKLLKISKILFTATGLVHFIKSTSSLLMRVIGHDKNSRLSLSQHHPRMQVEHLMQEGLGHGIISDEQSAIVERVLDLSSTTLEDEMTSWDDAKTVNINDSPDVLWELADRTHHSQFPVVDDDGLVVGVVSVYEALSHEKQQCPAISELTKPALKFDINTALLDALGRFQAERAAIAIVVDNNQSRGLVTIKDLVEPITGELASW